MKLSMLRFLCLCLLALPADSASVLTKVLSMLKNMKETGEKEKQEEAVQYAAYKTWCDGETASKTREVGELSDQVELLQAEVETAEASSGSFDEKLEGLTADMTKWTIEAENATALRKQQRLSYQETHKDFTESIQAIMGAQKALKDKAGASKALALLATLPLPAAEAKQVTSFLAMYHSDEAPQPEGLDAFDLSTSSITEMLDKLHDKFADERSELEKEETKRSHAHELLSQKLKTMLSETKASQKEMTQSKAASQQTAATKKAQAKDTEASLAEEQKYLKEVKAPLHDAFANWGYPFEKRKKTGFAAKANLVSDPTSYLWRYHSLPPAACGPHSGTPGGVSICLPEPSTEGRLRCDVQCMDNRTPTADTLRCGHYGAWVGQLHCLEEDDVLPSLWPTDGPRPPMVINRAHS